MSTAAPREFRPLDPEIWRACAGPRVRVPTVGSVVFYFPQGHAEQSSSPPDFSTLPERRPYTLCRITAVGLLSNLDTDEVFARIILNPVVGSPIPSPSPPPLPSAETEDGVTSFAKTLTASDANNGGGFSVPRYCADSIFPALDFDADPPLQNLTVCDVHGIKWNFRHIYRGTPRRHLLTTGWSKFVNSKKLVAGDSVVFIRNGAGELFVGVRRASRSCGDFEERPVGGLSVGEGFSRNAIGRIPAESVVEAASKADMNQQFEVVYYPKTGSPDFVVAADHVREAMGVCWTRGMRVKIALESDDTSRLSWFQGTVSAAALLDAKLWPRSPWRMLQVTWDEADVLPNIKTFNPWQVELASASGHPHSEYPVLKKIRASASSELPTDGEGNIGIPIPAYGGTMMGNSMVGNVAPSRFSYGTFPVGMQGARHDSYIESNTSVIVKREEAGKFDVSLDLSIGSTSASGSSSPQSQGSCIQSCNTQLFGTAVGTPTKMDAGVFRLFGQQIRIERPFNAETKEEHKMTDTAARPTNVLFSVHQRVPAVEAPSV